MTDPLDPRLKRALDAFTVPDLPGDFAERMVAMAMDAGGDAGETVPAAPPPAPRRRLRLWLGGMALAGAGFASFSAAAMGYLGEPLRNVVHRVPIVHRLVERLAPRHHHLPVGAGLALPVATPAPAAIAPAATPSAAPVIAPVTQPLVAGPGLRRAAAAAAIWRARHPDAPLPARLAVPPGAIRAARPGAAPGLLLPTVERPAVRLRQLRERRAARALSGMAPASPPPAALPHAVPPIAAPVAAPAAAPVVNIAPSHPEPAAGQAARPWRWWEQSAGEPLRRGRWQRRQAEGGPAPAPPPVPAVEHPESQTPPAEAPHAHPAEPRPHPPRAPHLPRPHGGGGRRRF